MIVFNGEYESNPFIEHDDTICTCTFTSHVLIWLTVHTTIYVNCILNITTTTFLFFSYNHHFTDTRNNLSLLFGSASSPLASSSWSQLRSSTRSLLWSAESPESKDHLNPISYSSLTVLLFWAYFTEMSFNFLYTIIILCCQAVFTSLFFSTVKWL